MIEYARDLLARGLAVIPVPHGEKGPKVKGWPDLRLTDADLPQHFNGRGNVGILLGEPSGWVIDVDLDDNLAVELAGQFLPPTPAIFGREGKPQSHWLYRVMAPCQTRKWSAQAGMVVELRATGCQTIAPGSTHPSGEAVRWDSDGEPATIAPDELVTAIEALAAEVDRRRQPVSLHASTTAPAAATLGKTPKATAAIEREYAAVARAGEGGRNDQLNQSAYNLGQLVGDGELDRGAAEASLASAARACGLDDREAARTIASGLGKGVANPRSTRPVGPGRSGAGAARVPAFTPFPLEALPEPVRSYVREGAVAIGCDPSYIALPMLSALASAIGNSRKLALKRSWKVPAVVWAVIVGESGTVKSPAIELATRFIKARQHRAMKEHADAMELWKVEHERFKRDREKFKRSKGVLDEPPIEPEQPVAVRNWTDDPTTEALAQILAQNPRGVILARDELSGWFGSFDRYVAGKGGDAAKWLEMFEGRSLMIDRKTSGTTYIPRASVCVTGGIQPGVLQRSLGVENFENGLAARFLFAMPPRTPKQWTEADVSADTEHRVELVFDWLFTLEPDYQDGDPVPRLVSLSAEAKTAFVAFVNDHGLEQSKRVGAESAAWAKLEGYAARLALVIHLSRWAAGADCDTDCVERVDVEAGILMVRWFAREAERLYALSGAAGGGGSLAAASQHAALIENVVKRGGSVSVRDIVVSGPQPYRGDSAATEAALRALVEAGQGSWEQPPQRGPGRPPARLFRLSRQPQDALIADSDSPGGISAINVSVSASGTEPDDIPF